LAAIFIEFLSFAASFTENMKTGRQWTIWAGLSTLVLALALTMQAADAISGDWTLLFDGKTTNGWHGFKKPGFPAKGWVVEEGCLHHLKNGGGGDIITAEQYSDFELQFEWKIGAGANSGVKYLILESRSGPIGIEYQLLDDASFANREGKPGSKWCSGSAYDLLPENPAAKALPVGEFNTSRIVLHGKHVEHWLNGVKSAEFELESDAFKTAIANSKFKKEPDFGKKAPGHILLQDHGGEVWFRNIKLRKLDAK
jgi:hypothetical protein